MSSGGAEYERADIVAMADGRVARREIEWKRIVTKCVDSVRLVTRRLYYGREE